MTPEEIVRGMTEAMRAMLLRARREWSDQPPRCYGPANTKKALRERGLGSGDFCYLTPLGLQVRTYLESKEGERG